MGFNGDFMAGKGHLWHIGMAGSNMINIWFIYVYITSIWINQPLIITYYNWLVVFRHPSEKYEFVSWDDDIPN